MLCDPGDQTFASGDQTFASGTEGKHIGSSLKSMTSLFRLAIKTIILLISLSFEALNPAPMYMRTNLLSAPCVYVFKSARLAPEIVLAVVLHPLASARILVAPNPIRK